jgi:hypothetical protein
MRRRKSFGSSMMTVVSMFTSTPHVDRSTRVRGMPFWNQIGMRYKTHSRRVQAINFAFARRGRRIPDFLSGTRQERSVNPPTEFRGRLAAHGGRPPGAQDAGALCAIGVAKNKDQCI